MRQIRSLLLIVFCGMSAVVYAAAALLFFWAPQDFLFKFVTNFCRLCLWAGDFFCGIKVVVEGQETLPDTPCVIMIKHTSALETYGHVPFFPRTTWVLKKNILLVPVFGWALALVFRPIAIDRNAGRQAVKQVISQGKQRLRDGIWVTVFPEGTRVPPNATRKYGISGAALAKEAGVPIIPMAHNAGDLWPRRAFTKQPGTVRFVIGPPIEIGERSAKEINVVVQDWIESKMQEISTAYKNKDTKT